jgi:predicted transcriptional regulator
MMKLEEIKTLRKNLDLTQSELARLSGVSQSLVARIESSKVDPSFSNAEKIFDALEKSRSKKIDLTAGNIMKKNVITIHPQEKVMKAASIMKRKNISQLPVVEKDKVIGTISEKEISHSISKTPRNLLVKDLMSDPLPLVSINTTVEMLSDLLDYYPAVLITESGRIKGIVCRSDLLKLVKR